MFRCAVVRCGVAFACVSQFKDSLLGQLPLQGHQVEQALLEVGNLPDDLHCAETRRSSFCKVETFGNKIKATNMTNIPVAPGTFSVIC